MNPEVAIEEGRAIGAQEDMDLDNLFQTAAPTGRFTATALNSLVGAFNEVLVSMGIPDPYPEFQAGQRALPGDLVKGLAMVADAADSVGIDNPVDLADVKDDTDLEMLAGKLMNLAADEEFAAEMTAMPSEEDAVGAELGVDNEPAAPGGDEEDLFMQRM